MLKVDHAVGICIGSECVSGHVHEIEDVVEVVTENEVTAVTERRGV